MRQPLALVALVLLSLGAFACGGASKSTNSPSGTHSNTAATKSHKTKSPVRNIGDDHDGDNDNELVRSFGNEADEADMRAVTALVKRYYAAAYAHDGARACSLIYSPLANAIAKEYGRPPAPPSLRSRTCAEFMTKFFVREHKRLAIDLATMRVSTVLVRGNNGWVMLYFGSARPERYFAVEREDGTWKMDTLLDDRLP